MTSASQLPDSFWLAEPLQLAIQAQDFGQLLRAYRHAHCPELTQETLATLLGITQGQISRIERGITLVQDLAKLNDWTRTLGVPDQYLWFKFDSKSCTSPTRSDTLDANAVKEDGEDVQRRQLLRTVGLGATLLGSSLMTPEVTASVQPIDNRPLNIDFMQDATETFRRLDNRYGGGHCRAMVDAILLTRLPPNCKLDATHALIDANCSRP